ncbi:sigma-70 family RNA polymerase sigma factor [Mangrovibacillus cuniculi]|uniref:Sigma-70 family RNA polymerase sigma factor n=1 Tax=Mangrovibacillus cuniculi TaxID=2593652 RepID=A0A7S8CDG0_9BACI|nr:sigma-70 family RNA polymerase sigma factor [Mangrovibacillus cuniculi]QPC47877.1 sigma-70 family RNA polymerase sigma factor [Mangrovibacillus cuniculi]
MEEIVLVNLIEHDPDALLDHLMDEHGQAILNLAYSYVKDVEIAKDLTQEIFIKTYQRIDQFQQKSSLKTWLWRIAINHCKDYVRSWNYRNVITTEDNLEESLSLGENTEQQVIKLEEESQLLKEVLHLPELYREVIYLFYFEESTLKEIAALLNINTNTVKTRLRRAKELLRQRLED